MDKETDVRNFTQEQARSMYRSLTLIAFRDLAWSAETLQEIARDYLRLIDNDPCPDCGKIPCSCEWGIEISISIDESDAPPPPDDNYLIDLHLGKWRVYEGNIFLAACSTEDEALKLVAQYRREDNTDESEGAK